MDNFKLLYEKYNRIKNMGYIPTMRDGSSGIGYTFETLLGKAEDNLFISDYNGIELKTLRKNYNYKLHLFSITPDGDYLYPIKRIVDMLGYPDKKNRNFKVFNVDVDAIEYKNISFDKKIKLKVNYNSQKIELLVLINNIPYDIGISWSFEIIKQRIDLKLLNLAIIMADNKYLNNKEFFWYNSISFYKIKDFSKFLFLVEKGIINITFKIGVYRSGKKYGMIHDRGTTFSIDLNNICLLYDKKVFI